MRIGFLVAGGVDRSGTRRVVPTLLDLLDELSGRHEVRVVALRQEPRPGSWRVAGVDVRNVGTRPRRLRALAHLARAHAGAPFDVLVGEGLVPQGALAALARTLLSVPCVVTAPGGDFSDLGEIGFGGWRNRRGRFWVRMAVRGCGALLVPSEPARLLARGRGAEAVRIPLPLSTRAWPRRGPVATPPGIPRIAWIGSLNRVKNPGLLVETIRFLKARGTEVAVDVVGEDFLRGSVQASVQAAGLGDSFTFHGFLRQEEVRRVLEGATLLLVTSRFEGGPRVVLEAASLGVPSVGTAVGYLEEWSPEAALAVADADSEKLGVAVEALLADEARRRALGEGAVARLTEHHPAAVADAWDAVFDDVLEGGRDARG